MISIKEDKSSDSFKFKAEIETINGERVHMVLPNVENFLHKLDAAQREMGRSPQHFVPVRYANASEGD